MTARILILNGPSLNLLGVREPHIYGTTTLAAIEASCRKLAGTIGVSLDFRQSNHEGVLVDWVQDALATADGIIINPAACTFTSVALRDALAMCQAPIVELHISNIHARDEIHRHSLISPIAKAVICGLGAQGYPVALHCVAAMLGALPPDAAPPARGL